jgi:hypothetical protein
MSKPILTQEYLKAIFYYDGSNLRWNVRKAMRNRVGDVAGCINEEGYRHIMIDGYKFLAHRLIWFMFYGDWPEEIDHINRVRDDNRLNNLRSADRKINMRNVGVGKTNRSGFRGVEFRDSLKYRKWVVYIGGGKSHAKVYLGAFSTLEEALSMRFTAEDAYY